jgi:hypothetical protein
MIRRSCAPSVVASDGEEREFQEFEKGHFSLRGIRSGFECNRLVVIAQSR